jgi:hypothetical protein
MGMEETGANTIPTGVWCFQNPGSRPPHSLIPPKSLFLILQHSSQTPVSQPGELSKQYILTLIVEVNSILQLNLLIS